MPSGKPYILFCAGEDSGDCIGEMLVSAAKECSNAFDFVGAGGGRMQSAGLKPLVDFEVMPVSGFGDVLPKYLKLRQNFAILKKSLMNPACLGLVAIDYPGFNMKLAALAGQLNKPCLYVAPPQVWAWKAKRAERLSRIPNTALALFFEFEKNPYEAAGCKVSLFQHPFVNASANEEEVPKESILLLPGSRLSQALRNVPVLLNIAERFPTKKFIFVAARQSLLPAIKEAAERFFKGAVPSWLQFDVSPESAARRSALYRNSLAAVTAPGTATLELSLSGCPFMVCTKPDVLTYNLGKHFVKTDSFALPNIILNENVYPEFIQSKWDEPQYKNAADVLNKTLSAAESSQVDFYKDVERRLRQKIGKGKTPSQLMSEFLAQFL